MMRAVAMVAVSVMLLGFWGCASEAETAMDDVVSTLEAIADRLAKIKTKDDLSNARADLKELGAKLKKQTLATDTLEKASPEERQRLQTKYQARMEKAQARMQEQMDRISKDLGSEAMLQVGSMLDA